MKHGLTAVLGAALAVGPVRAASFDDLLGGFGSTARDQVEDYAQPLGDALAGLTAAGAFHSGRSKGITGLDVGLKLMMAPLGGADIPAGSLLDETDVSAVGLPVLTAAKGLVKGFQVGARFSSLELSKDVGKVGLVGASLRFELTEIFHVPLVTPRVAVQADWSRLTVGDAVTTTALGLDLIASKSFVMLEPYAGLSLVKGTTDLEYTSGAAGLEGQSVSLSLDSRPVRLAAGLNVTPFPLLRVNAEYALADYPTITVGVLLNLF